MDISLKVLHRRMIELKATEGIGALMQCQRCLSPCVRACVTIRVDANHFMLFCGSQFEKLKGSVQQSLEGTIPLPL